MLCTPPAARLSPSASSMGQGGLAAAWGFGFLGIVGFGSYGFFPSSTCRNLKTTIGSGRSVLVALALLADTEKWPTTELI